MRVLVIEDDADLNRQLATAFKEAGYAVDTATDGEEGHFLGDTEPDDTKGQGVESKWWMVTPQALAMSTAGGWSAPASG